MYVVKALELRVIFLSATLAGSITEASEAVYLVVFKTGLQTRKKKYKILIKEVIIIQWSESKH